MISKKLNLHSLVKLRLKDRVEIIDHWISDEQRAAASSFACIYIPIDEDSYGYVSLSAILEGHHNLHGLGGTLELIQHRINGLIVYLMPKNLQRRWTS
jgi:hypothetical protein